MRFEMAESEEVGWFEADEEEFERVAEKVHEAWMEEKTRQGSHYPGLCKNYPGGCNYCHPNIKCYSELDEKTKEIDRATVRAVVEALNQNLIKE